MNQLILDLSDPDIKEALKGCADGENVKFTVAGELSTKGSIATIQLDSVEYSGSNGEEGSAKEEAAESPEDEADEKETGMDEPDSADRKVPKAVKSVSKY